MIKEEEEPILYDAIIVGLGCFGLGTAYYLSKEKQQIIGFDKSHKPGAMGSGSVGYGRIWRYLHTEPRYCEMQKEAVEIWREVEQKIGKQILTGGGLLYIKKKDHQDFKELEKYGIRYSAEQITKKWPALIIPDYLEGVYTFDAGVLRVKDALDSFLELSKKQGADLRYNIAVSHIDHENWCVTTDDGKKYHANNIIVTCGALSDQFYQMKKQFKMQKQMVHCYYLDDCKDLPPAFLMEDLLETKGIMVFGTLDGDKFDTYKVGNELEDIDPHLMLAIMKIIMPTKVNKINHIQACFYSMTHDDEFIFEKSQRTIYGFGCNGRGFKHMPYHGKRIYHLLKGNFKEANKYKKIEKSSNEVIAKL